MQFTHVCLSASRYTVEMQCLCAHGPFPTQICTLLSFVVKKESYEKETKYSVGSEKIPAEMRVEAAMVAAPAT